MIVVALLILFGAIGSCADRGTRGIVWDNNESAGVEFADGLGVYTYPIKKADGTTVYNAPIPVFFGLRNFYGNLWCGKNRIVAEKQADKSYRFFVAKSSLTSWDYSKTSEMLHVGDLAGVETAGWRKYLHRFGRF